MNFRNSIKRKTIAVFLIILISVILLSAGISLGRNVSLTSEILGKQAMNAANQAFIMVNSEKLETIINNMDDRSLEYKELRDKLSEFRAGLGLKYLYIMTKNKAGQYIYLVDGLSPLSDEFSNLGDVEKNKGYYKNFDRAMSGQIVQNVISFGDKWGNLVSVYLPIRNNMGKVIAFLGVDLQAGEMMELMGTNTTITIVYTLVICIMGAFAILYFSTKLTAPLIKLRDYTIKVINGEEVPFYEFNVKDEVGELAEVLNDKIESIRTILNNAGEGFLTFDKNLIIDKEFSSECIRIFNRKDIQKSTFAELVFPYNRTEKELMENIFKNIFSEKNSIKKSAYLSLLISEVIIEGRSIKIDYKLIDSKYKDKQIIMVVLKDISEKRQLENKLVKEKNALDMVVKVLVNFNDFSDLVRMYNNFCSSELWEIIMEGKSSKDKLLDIYRIVHTFKGDFGIYGLGRLVDRLHKLEMEITNLQGVIKYKNSFDFEGYFKSKKLEDWLSEDLEIIKSVIGTQYADKIMGKEKNIIIDNRMVEKLKDYVNENLVGEERNKVLREIRKLEYVPFNKLLKLYPDYMIQIANRLEKEILMPEITGGDFLVDAKRYKEFTNSLVHIFKNGVDHGIENMEERVELNKEEAGTIECSAWQCNENIIITIRDDGRGIDIDRLKEKAIEKSLITDEEAKKLSNKAAMNLIFRDEISTKVDITEISGRGVGLSAFMNELKNLKGSVEVESKQGYGTSFKISVPYIEAINGEI